LTCQHMPGQSLRLCCNNNSQNVQTTLLVLHLSLFRFIDCCCSIGSFFCCWCGAGTTPAFKTSFTRQAATSSRGRRRARRVSGRTATRHGRASHTCTRMHMTSAPLPALPPSLPVCDCMHHPALARNSCGKMIRSLFLSGVAGRHAATRTRGCRLAPPLRFWPNRIQDMIRCLHTH
jgi:hypothetical protein